MKIKLAPIQQALLLALTAASMTPSQMAHAGPAEPPCGAGGGSGSWDNGVWYPEGVGIHNVFRQQGLPEPVALQEPLGGSGGGYGNWENGVWIPQGVGIHNINRQYGVPDGPVYVAHGPAFYGEGPNVVVRRGHGGLSQEVARQGGVSRTEHGVVATGVGVGVHVGAHGVSAGIGIQAGGVQISLGVSSGNGGHPGRGSEPSRPNCEQHNWGPQAPHSAPAPHHAGPGHHMGMD